jgi:hypothetical protein
MDEKMESIPDAWWSVSDDSELVAPTDEKLMQLPKRVLVAEIQKLKRDEHVALQEAEKESYFLWRERRDGDAERVKTETWRRAHCQLAHTMAWFAQEVARRQNGKST